MLSRYHLWFAAPSRRAASRRAITRQRCNGRSRSTPTGPKAVGVPAPRCIRRPILSPFHRARGSLCRSMTVTGPLLRCIQGVLYLICGRLSTKISKIIRGFLSPLVRGFRLPAVDVLRGPHARLQDLLYLYILRKQRQNVQGFINFSQQFHVHALPIRFSFHQVLPLTKFLCTNIECFSYIITYIALKINLYLD